MKIRYHKEKYPDLPQVVQHGNFIDLYVAKGCHLKEGEFKLIDLGVSVECPEGYWMQLVPRSSTFKKYGIIQTNSFGVIDTSYCGDNDIVMLPVYATRNTRIPKGERICQFRLVKDIPFNIVEVDKLEGPDRGGFGSTGKK
jgi:dUTP pyrophosphatase